MWDKMILLVALFGLLQVAASPLPPEPIPASFAEVIAFINDDHTNWREYQQRDFVCIHFACTVQRVAQEQGIKCAMVHVILNGPVSHAIVAFDTTDKGIVFFEPQNDDRMIVEVGRKYWSWTRGYNYNIDYDDTVTEIVFYWESIGICKHLLRY